MGILRLSHVEVCVDDLELCAAYYVEVLLGLIEVAREPERVYLKCWDEHDHHSLILKHAPGRGLEHMSFKVEREEDLDELERAAESWGYAVRRMAAGEEPGQGEAIRFETPTGHHVELVHRMDKAGSPLPKTNPPPQPLDLAGSGFSSRATFAPEVHPTVVWTKFQALAEGARLASDRLCGESELREPGEAALPSARR